MTLYEICEQKLYYFKYADNTIKTYLYYIDEFERRVGKHYSRLTAKDIQHYLDGYNFTSISMQNQVISSLKFAWKYGLRKKYLKINFKRPRKERKLPKVIDKNFLIDRITAIENKKHKAILWLAYSTGMRVSEVVNLKICDVDSKQMIIHIRNAKGRKDRIVPLSHGTLDVLRGYFKEYKPTEYLFNGQLKNTYSTTSCNKIVKKYLGHDKHFHLLRHSSFTSMLDGGTDLRIIQGIAGHKNYQTTTIYTHLSLNSMRMAQVPI